MVYNVKKTTSNSFIVNLNYSQNFNITTSMQLSQNNFLGDNNRMTMKTSHNNYQQHYTFSYTNPFFTNNNVSLNYNLS